jgi:hypothetical protein
MRTIIPFLIFIGVAFIFGVGVGLILGDPEPEKFVAGPDPRD